MPRAMQPRNDMNLMVEATQQIECGASFEQTGGHGRRKVFIAQTEVYVLILCV